ncbi:MAG: HlyD family efflux transporter periplasmic adaptor subunit [Acidobacteriota bacterium]
MHRFVAGLLLLALGCTEAEAPTMQSAEPTLLEVEFSGELFAQSSADIGPPAIGSKVSDFRLASLVEEGRVVSAGDPVLSFDTSQLEERLLRQIADRDSSRKTLEKQRKDLALEREQLLLTLAEAEANERRLRLQSDVPEDVISARELDILRLDLELAGDEVEHRTQLLETLQRRTDFEIRSLQARLARQQLEVRELEELIERMTLFAPRSGTVVYRTNWEGEKKKVGDSVWRMEKILQIPDLDTLAVRASVDEAHAGLLLVGQRATLRLDAHPDRVFGARVHGIKRRVQRKSWRDPRRIVGVELELDEIDSQRMKPGMRLTGSLDVSVPGADPDGDLEDSRGVRGR